MADCYIPAELSMRTPYLSSIIGDISSAHAQIKIGVSSTIDSRVSILSVAVTNPDTEAVVPAVAVVTICRHKDAGTSCEYSQLLSGSLVLSIKH